MPDQFERLKIALADRYEIEREIGAGGMANVYLARDLRHDREVAVKVLRPDLAAALGTERFLREIKIAANLTHPHIVPLYDSGEAEGFLYYVMPYIEGESLRQRIEREKQLPIEEAIRIAQEVAAALSYAHSHGVVHRDIKPENILLSHGEVVVADLGIAHAVAESGGERLTESGLAIGTPAYMSPEQASGEEIDGRSDIYSLSCVLYEMFTGEPPFGGPSAQAILSRHAVAPVPSIRTVRTTVPKYVEDAVMRALEKVPADRFKVASQFSVALSGQSAEVTIEKPPALRQHPKLPTREAGVERTISPGRRRATIVIAAAAALASMVGAGVLLRGDRESSAPVTQVYQQLTFIGDVGLAAISPDGQFLAYVSETDDTLKLFVQGMSGGSPLEIAAGVDNVATVRWSPDGTELLFVGEYEGRWGGYIVPRLGGTPRRIPSAAFAHWSPDGSQVASWWVPRKRISLTDLATGDTSSIALTGSFEFLSAGDWSPSGNLIAFATSAPGEYSLWTITVDGSRQELVLEDTLYIHSPRWSPAGDALYYLRGGDELRKIRVSPETGTPRGASETLLTALQAGTSFTRTDDGHRLVYTKVVGHSNLWLVTVEGSGHSATVTTTQLTTGTAMKGGFRVSPDGAWIAYLREGSRGHDIFKMPIEGGPAQQLTFTGGIVSAPAWSPDGRRLAFGTSASGTVRVSIMSATGGPARAFERTDMSAQLAWAPEQRILYQRPGNRNFHLLDPTTEEERALVPNDSVGWMFYPHYLPDGERLAVSWNRRPQRGVWVISLRDSSQVLLRAGQSYPYGWSTDGKGVFVKDRDAWDLRLVPLAGGEGRIVVTLPQDCNPQWVAPDGRRILCSIHESVSDVWMIENFDPAAP